MDIPEEVQSSKLASYDHSGVFGCHAFMYTLVKFCEVRLMASPLRALPWDVMMKVKWAIDFG